MQQFTDQTGHCITLTHVPKRIVSIVPSQTELLHALGLEAEVAGITKFCIHPKEWFENKTRIGGTKTIYLQKVFTLHPDLIIANKEENTKEDVEALREKVPVYTSDISTLEDALNMIEDISTIVGKQASGQLICKKIQTGFMLLQHALENRQQKYLAKPLKAAYLIWKEPWMVAGGDTFINDMLERCGITNAFANTARYPTTTIEEIAALECNLLLLSSEPYPFKQKHMVALRQQLPHTQVLLVDGEMFSWYGSRLQFAPAYFMQLSETILSNQLH